jgi:hypothetical protein
LLSFCNESNKSRSYKSNKSRSYNSNESNESRSYNSNESNESRSYNSEAMSSEDEKKQKFLKKKINWTSRNRSNFDFFGRLAMLILRAQWG